jgi:hypothetical protein
MLIGKTTTVERAYELARSGGFRTVSEIKARLRAEGYYDVMAQIEGRAIVAALRKLLLVSRPEI